MWVDASANRVATACTSAPLCARRLTQRRTLGSHSHGKARSAPATPPRRDQRAHSGRATSRKGALCVWPHQRAHSACERWLRREAIFADLCTLLHTHGRSRDRAGPWVPRRRRPHGPRDARALGPEAHATGAVTQPPTHASSRSLTYYPRNKALRGFMWVAASAKTPTWQRRHSRRAYLPDQAGGASEGTPSARRGG